MLRLVLFLPMALLALSLSAQNLTIQNNVNCDMRVTVQCATAIPPFCNGCFLTVCVPAGGVIVIPPCSAACTGWARASVCSSAPGCGAFCNCAAVSWIGCGGLPNITPYVPACVPCQGLPLTVDATVPNFLRIF